MAAKMVAAKVAKVTTAAARIERARARATAAGVVIVGRGWRVRDGALAWRVPSQSEPGRCYHVVMVGDRLRCECKGAHDFAAVCIHQGAVYNELASEAQAFAAAQRRIVASASTAAPVMPAAHPGATAPLHRDNAPVSIWRA